MKHFPQHWRQLAAQARAARPSTAPGPSADEAASWVPQLLRRRTAHAEATSASVVELWGWYAPRGLAVGALAMLLCVAFAWRGLPSRPSLRPTVEIAIAGALTTL